MNIFSILYEKLEMHWIREGNEVDGSEPARARSSVKYINISICSLILLFTHDVGKHLIELSISYTTFRFINFDLLNVRQLSTAAGV